MTVMEYVARFTELARFADDYMTTDVAKVRRFENGLKLPIRGRIVGLRLQDMNSMVGTTLTIEREIKDARGHEFQDQGQDGAFSQAGQMICYFCRQLGHVRRDCPQRQGSQDFGTAQSQLAVEQESIQFIPPHPSMG